MAPSIKETMDSLFKVDPEKIKKMASVDIAAGGQLPLPEKGESVTIRMLSAPKLVKNDKLPNKDGAISARCAIFGKEAELTYDLWLSQTIYKGVLAELAKKNVPVDNDLKCIINRVFTIAGRDWPNAPAEMWKEDPVTHKRVSPKTYSIALREDLEAQSPTANATPEGTAPEMMSF